MPTRIIMRGQAGYYAVEEFREDIVKAWDLAVSDGGSYLATYTRLDAGIPRPQVTIDLREVAAVEEERR